MKETMSLLHSEWLKICSTKAFRVSMAFMLLLVPVVSWLEGRQYLSICFSLATSFLSIYFSYMVMHLALGKEGLDPILLNQAAWSLILWKTLSLTLLGILSFLLGLLARTMLVPLLFLVPQIYNLGNYLAAHTSWGAYLPQPAGELFVATPTSQYANNPLQGLLILSVWLLVIGVMASLRFLKTDLGGRY